jgi:hypothetical protein
MMNDLNIDLTSWILEYRKATKETKPIFSIIYEETTESIIASHDILSSIRLVCSIPE